MLQGSRLVRVVTTVLFRRLNPAKLPGWRSAERGAQPPAGPHLCGSQSSDETPHLQLYLDSSTPRSKFCFACAAPRVPYCSTSGTSARRSNDVRAALFHDHVHVHVHIHVDVMTLMYMTHSHSLFGFCHNKILNVQFLRKVNSQNMSFYFTFKLKILY